MLIDASSRPIHGSWTRTTDAIIEPIDMAQAVAWARLTDDDANSNVLPTLIKAARQKIEEDTGLALYTQTWTYAIDRIPASRQIPLPIWPVQSVTSVTAYSPSDSGSVVSTSVYRADTASQPARLVLKENQSWTSDVRPQDAFSIVFVAGWSDISAIPESLLVALRLLVGHWYEHRESVVVGTTTAQVELAYSHLIAPWKQWWLL